MIQDTKISLIAAIGKNRELGKDNDLLFKISDDLKRFKSITSGHPVIMGRKTFDSLKRPQGLPGRLNIILTRNTEYQNDNVRVCSSLEEAIKIAKEVEEKSQIPHTKEIFIIGGQQIFDQSIHHADRLYLTLVDEEAPSADVFFPEYSEFTKVIEETKQESDGYKFTFLTLEK